MRESCRKVVAGCGIGLLVAAMAAVAQAKPSFGVSCGQCHTKSRNGMAVGGYDALRNLGEGDLKTFTVEPGQSVSFSVRVTDGHDKYAVVLRDLDKGAVLEDNSNKLVFTPDSGWINYLAKSPPYCASTSSKHSWGGSTRQFIFDLQVDASTPADFYALRFELAGKNGGKWSQREKFYLHVLPGQPMPGDVDMYDFSLFALHWPDRGCGLENDFCSGADVDVDGDLDFDDLMELALHWLTRKPLEIPIAGGADDAEESISNGSVNLTSGDLELIHDNDDQLVGIRFNELDLDQGAYVASAYIQFTVDEVSTGPCALVIEGQASDNAGPFTSTVSDISSRPRTNASVDWSVPQWNIVGQAGPDQ